MRYKIYPSLTCYNYISTYIVGIKIKVNLPTPCGFEE